MQLINSSYFVGDISLSQNKYNSANLDLYIVKIEKEILIKLLGYDLYKSFSEAIDSGTPAQKWIDLRDGKEYQVTNEDGVDVYVKWEGLLNATSLISYFIYFYYVLETQSINTGSGDVVLKGTNSETTSISQLNNKLVANYNKGVDLYGVYLKLLISQNAILRSKSWQNKIDYSKGLKNYYEEILKGTAFNYLYFMNEQNGDDYYANWKFTEINKINTFGI